MKVINKKQKTQIQDKYFSLCAVSFGYFGTKSSKGLKSYKNGGLLINDAMMNEQSCALLNAYEANSVKEHLNTIDELQVNFVF